MGHLVGISVTYIDILHSRMSLARCRENVRLQGWANLQKKWDYKAGWWFGRLFIFHNIWNNPSHWLINIFQDGWNHQPERIRTFPLPLQTSVDVRRQPALSRSQRGASLACASTAGGLWYNFNVWQYMVKYVQIMEYNDRWYMIIHDIYIYIISYIYIIIYDREMIYDMYSICWNMLRN